jgi:hypothetical protein
MFENYFREFFRSLLLIVCPFLGIRLAFAVDENGDEEFWKVSFRSGKIEPNISFSC